MGTEYAYRPLLENEVWGAGVACVQLQRHNATEKWLVGSPELTLEVKSPSNTKAKLYDKAMTTLAGDGAGEFWIVDSDLHMVTVYSKARGVEHYASGAVIPVRQLDATIAVDDIFA